MERSIITWVIPRLAKGRGIEGTPLSGVRTLGGGAWGLGFGWMKCGLEGRGNNLSILFLNINTD